MLGITVGALNSVAVATMGDPGDSDGGSATGTVARTHPTILRLTTDAAPTRAESTGRHSSDVILESFLARVGDPVDIPPLRNTDVADDEFDLLTIRYIPANTLRGKEFDPFDPVIERELSQLRDRRRNVKENLSINTATVVPVRVDPAAQHADNIRLVRDELADLLRGPLLGSATTAPGLPSDTSSNTGDTVGGVVGTVLRLPGQIVGGAGG